MPWNEQKGGGGGGPWGGGSGGSGNGGGDKGPGGTGSGPGGGDKSPWGRPSKPSGSGGGGNGGGDNKPDLEESIRRMQERFRRGRGGGGNGRSGGPSGGRSGRGLGSTGVLIVIGVAFVGWLMTGVYTVNEQEAAVVMRFGTVHRTEGPGFHVRFPSPIEEQLIVPVNRSQFIEIGATENESLILTRDGNIVDIDFAINWKVASPEKYLFSVVDTPSSDRPNELIRQVGESAMREVVGNEDFVPLITSARGNVEGRVLKIMQDVLNSYNSGVDIVSISLKKSSAPPDVLDAQRDVTSAQQDREKKNNEGRSYLNKVTNEAEGEAARLRKEADGYRDSTIAVSRGEADGFTKVYDEYRRSPESRRVTRERIFLETMEEVIGRTNKVIVDTKTGVVPVLPLDQLRPRQQQ